VPKNYLTAARERVANLRISADEVRAGRRPPGFIPTGLTALDSRGGIRRGCLTIFGGATGEGKSVLKLHLATAAAKEGLKVEIIDMEDPLDRTVDRSLSTETGLNNAQLGTGQLTDLELARMDAAVTEMEWAERISVHDGLLSATEALGVLRQSEADVWFVDYLQGFPDGEGLERTIANFCWDANKLAQERNIGVVAFSQVRADVEHRGLRAADEHRRRHPDGAPHTEGFRPFGPADLAWCSAAGQRCKELWFMHRPGRYARRLGDRAAKDNVLELSAPKRNWGAEGTVRLRFDGPTATIGDLA